MRLDRLTALPVATSQTITVVSSLPDTRNLLSGVKAKARVQCLCFFKSRSGLPEGISHSLIMPSYPPVASVLPSGEKATDQTVVGWPSSEALRRPSVGSQS